MTKTTTLIIVSCLLVSFTIQTEKDHALTISQEKNLAQHPSNTEDENFIQNLDKTISQKNQGKIAAAINILSSILHGDFYENTNSTGEQSDISYTHEPEDLPADRENKNNDEQSNEGGNEHTQEQSDIPDTHEPKALPANRENENNNEQVNEANKLTREQCDIPDTDEIEALPANREKDFAKFVEDYGKKYEDPEFQIIKDGDHLTGYVDAQWKDIFNPNILDSETQTPYLFAQKNDLIPSVITALNLGNPNIIQIGSGSIS